MSIKCIVWCFYIQQSVSVITDSEAGEIIHLVASAIYLACRGYLSGVQLWYVCTVCLSIRPSIWICHIYIVHHCNSTELRYAPSTCTVHHGAKRGLNFFRNTELPCGPLRFKVHRPCTNSGGPWYMDIAWFTGYRQF